VRLKKPVIMNIMCYGKAKTCEFANFLRMTKIIFPISRHYIFFNLHMNIRIFAYPLVHPLKHI